MDDMKVQITGQPLASGSAIAPLAPARPAPSVLKTGPRLGLLKVLHQLASLRLTVVLFALSIFLVFSGTIAQVDSGIWTVVDKYFRSFYVWIPLQIFVPQFLFDMRPVVVGGGFPFPGGWLLGSLLLVNLLAAHAVRFKLTWKRSGIIVLHSGLVIMMVSELVTGLFAVEGSMLIYEGKSANFVTHPRETELAIVPEGKGETTDVTVVPMALLRGGAAPIKADALPFDVEVLQYMVNSALCKQNGPPEFLPSDFASLPIAPASAPNQATEGLGVKLYVAVDQHETGGMEQSKEDQPAAYVRFLHKQTGKDLGTYLMAVLLEDTPQYVTVDGKKYDVRLRLKRSYKPYTMRLIKFSHDRYMGTDKPKNFSSLVRLTDPSKSEDREVKIYMNNPLYYGGETFYQQSFLPGDKATILQVVKNPGWPMPYLSFTMVALGLMIHFGIRLTGFLSTAGLQRQKKGVSGSGLLLPSSIAAGCGILYFLAVMVPPGDSADQMRLYEAAKLPVAEGGRVMPIDTVARNNLMIISGKQEFVDGQGNTQPAIKWMFDVLTTHDDKGPALDHKVFRIENDQVLAVLNLNPRSGLRYSLAEILDHYSEFDRQFNRARAIPVKDRDLFDHKIFELAEHLKLYQDLNQMESPLVIPPRIAGGEWLSLRKAAQDMQQGRRDTALEEFAVLLSAYMKGDIKAFNAGLTAYQQLIDKQLSKDVSKTSFETFFNHFAPFYQCMILYVLVLLLTCASWITFPKELRRAAFALALVILAVHTFALVGRMYLMDRPLVFVTNLYSSAVFIGWICVILGLMLELIYRNGLGIFVASATGSLTLLIGHYLATTGDTLEMMQAVLDTNFWLATHVTCVTFGYAATFVAGFLGMVFIVLRLLPVKLDNEVFKTVGRMIYGIVCFAMLFSFVGTVLGGLWADYSWGRFWGWDPKENGALLIVLMNALILHARWSGMVKLRGLAVLAVAGNIVTAWSWFGVNMLGVGLHSYGFMSGAVWWLLAFVASQLIFIALGLLPARLLPARPQAAV
jgi:ABC-type transport system involved in cytochrome c biogenesis permease subunit